MPLPLSPAGPIAFLAGALAAVSALVALRRRRPPPPPPPPPVDHAALARVRFAGSSPAELLGALDDPATSEGAAELLLAALEDPDVPMTAEDLRRSASLGALRKFAENPFGPAWPESAPGEPPRPPTRDIQVPLPTAPLRAAARRRLASLSADPTEPLRPDATGLRCVGALEAHDFEPWLLVPHGDRWLASRESSGRTLLWDLPNRSFVEPPAQPSGILVTPDRRAHLRPGGGSVAILRPGETEPDFRIAGVRGATPAALAGNRVALLRGGPSEATVTVFDFPSGRELFRRDGLGWDNRSGDALLVGLSPAGSFVVLDREYGTNVEIVELATGRVAYRSVPGDRETRFVAFASDSVALVDRGSRCDALDLVAGGTRFSLAGPTGPLAVEGRTGDIWRVTGGRLERRDPDGALLSAQQLDGAKVASLAPDPRTGAVAEVRSLGWDEQLQQWRHRVVVRKPDGEIRATVEPAIGAAFLPGADADLATSGRFGTVWLWRYEA